MKTGFSAALITLALTSFVSSANADGYIRPGSGVKADRWKGIDGAKTVDQLPQIFQELRADFGGVIAVDVSGGKTYVKIPGELQSSTTGPLKLQTYNQDKKQREYLVLPSKAAADTFCARLIKAGHGFSDSDGISDESSVFASDWAGGIKYVITVDYKADYQGPLTPAIKTLPCSNPWGTKQNPNVPAENDLVGIKASGAVKTDDWTYHVVCADPRIAPLNLRRIDNFDASMIVRWTDGKKIYRSAFSFDRISNYWENLKEYLDEDIGKPYCGG